MSPYNRQKQALVRLTQGDTIAVSDALYDQRLAGVLLVLAFILSAIGGTLPVVGEEGNLRIFTLSLRVHLLAVAGNAVVWRLANVFMGAAAVALLAGMSVLSTLLEGSNERVFSRLGLVVILLALTLWLIFPAFRAVVTVGAAVELTTTGAIPAYFRPLAQWSFVLFLAYADVGFLALAAYAVSILRVGLLPAWTGWATLAFSIVMLIRLLAKGDTLPASLPSGTAHRNSAIVWRLSRIVPTQATKPASL